MTSMEEIKLDFIDKLRKNLSMLVKDLTEEDFDENEKVPGGEYLISNEENLRQCLYDFYNPFTIFLDDCQEGAFFISDDMNCDSFGESRIKFIELTKFIIQIFEYTVKIFEQKVIKQHDYQGLLPEFDNEVVRKFLY